ncbi:MAG: hypothetical protein ACLPY5_11660, partial [Candidatus Bathyarchaeia archaeon]
MLKPKGNQFGLLGLGQVGRNIIRRYGSLGFHWVSDSKGIWRRTDGLSLREIDLTHIMKSKNSRLPKDTVRNVTYEEFDNLTKQTDLLQSIIGAAVSETSHSGTADFESRFFVNVSRVDYK